MSWVDSTLTHKFKAGYQDLFNKDNVSAKFSNPDEFTPVNAFKHPLAFGLQDGEMHLLWFEEEVERDLLADALRASELANQEPLPGHKYLIRQPKNAFVTSIYRTLRLNASEVEDPRIMKGMLARALNKKADMF